MRLLRNRASVSGARAAQPVPGGFAVSRCGPGARAASARSGRVRGIPTGPGARDASARSGRVRGIPLWPWSPRCQRPFRAGSRYPHRPWSPRCQRPFRAGSRYPAVALEPALPSPFRAGSRYPAVCKNPDTAEAPAEPVRTADSRRDAGEPRVLHEPHMLAAAEAGTRRYSRPEFRSGCLAEALRGAAWPLMVRVLSGLLP